MSTSEPEGPATPLDPPADAGAGTTDLLLQAPVQMDAPPEQRATFFQPTVGVRVAGPGQAETVGGAPRAARHGAHNWVPIGPRNVGGRVRAIAVDPAHPEVMYAASASGGVFKTIDGAESWFPLWHDEPSLSLAALAICHDHTEVVWAGTGESTSGGGEVVPGAGVLRSTDSGGTWTQPVAGEAIRGVRVHALAAHPTDRDRCWAATSDGLFRTIDGGLHWVRFGAGRVFTDVLLATVGASLRLFAVVSGFGLDPLPAPGRHRPLVLRLDSPDDTDGAAATSLAITTAIPDGPVLLALGVADPLLPLTGTFPLPASPVGELGDGKLALYPGGAPGFANPVLYVLYANDRRGFGAIFRSQNPGAGTPAQLTWARVTPHPVFAGEGQGTYNLAIAVSPRNPNHLAFGMVELFLTENANANSTTVGQWKRAQLWDLYHLERGHHADHHALVFAPSPPAPFDGGLAAGTIVLWDTNDGGVSACADWQGSTSFPIGGDAATSLPAGTLPLPVGAPTWRKRSHGISASQMYDLTQHPRLPTVLGSGFQDNGAYLGTGGPSWQLLLTADGGFVAFDPDDPYRAIVTWQSGITESRFPGALREALPMLRDGIVNGLWPRELTDGFLVSDPAPFVSETALHPSLPGRLLNARRNRLYGTRPTTGDRWIPEALGHGFEILHAPTARQVVRSSIEVVDGAAARALGLFPQRVVTVVDDDPDVVSAVRSLVGAPFQILDRQVVELVFRTAGGGAPTEARVRVTLRVGADLPARSSAAQVAAYLERECRTAVTALGAATPPRVQVTPIVWEATPVLGIVASGSGHGTEITIASNHPEHFNVIARTFFGADAGAGGVSFPAYVPLMFGIEWRPDGSFGRLRIEGTDLRGVTLHLEREGGAAPVDIVCNTAFADPARVTYSDLVDVLRARLPATHYSVIPGPIRFGIRLTARAAGDNVTLSGDLAADLSLSPANGRPSVRISNSRTFDLRPVGTADRRLRVGVGGAQTANQQLTTAFLGVTSLVQVTSIELGHAIRRMVTTGAGLPVRCDFDLHLAGGGNVTELAFGPPGSRRVWAGDATGRVWRSEDDGERWEEIDAPFTDRFLAVEAIAICPADPDVVLVGLYAEGSFPAHVHTLYRRDAAGGSFAPVRSPILDAAGNVVGIQALQFDAVEADRVYAGTDVGVFRSDDRGDTWAPFSEGMPNVRVVDLAYEPTTRMLRAGAWGRGVYERHVGERPARDVRLHVRSTALDDGTAQPYPGPDLLSAVAAPLRLDASPDVKQTRRDPRRGLLLDGVEYDDELRHEDVREGPAFICAQIHNRGAFPTSTARVAVLWAPADAGPPPLGAGLADALAAGPLAVNATFGQWTVISDAPLPDPHNLGHAVVAPGYPRIAVVGAAPAPFSWPAAVSTHRRVGILVLVRCDEDPLALSTTDVLDLIRTEAKAAYRESAVVTAAEDGRIVLRSTRGFRVDPPTPASVGSLVNGAAPLGLSAAPAGSLEVELARPEPYDLSGPVRGFAVRPDDIDITISFPADGVFRDLQRADGNEVAAAVNRVLEAAGVPVRASAGTFGNRRPAVFLAAIGATTFAASGTAAAILGLTSPAGTINASTDNAHQGPWDLRPVPAAKDLRLVVRTTVEVRLGPGTPGLPVPGASTAAEVRAAINRQLLIGGAIGVEAAPRRLRLSVRRSASEAAGSRIVSGGYALADLFASTAQVASAEDRLARLRPVAAEDRDTVGAGQPGFLYVRAANVGTLRAAPARVRLFELVVAGDGTVSRTDIGSATDPVAPGAATVVEIPFDPGARESGSRVFVLAVADTTSEPLDPPATFPSLEAADRFCVDRTAAAIRELVVA